MRSGRFRQAEEEEEETQPRPETLRQTRHLGGGGNNKENKGFSLENLLDWVSMQLASNLQESKVKHLKQLISDRWFKAVRPPVCIRPPRIRCSGR